MKLRFFIFILGLLYSEVFSQTAEKFVESFDTINKEEIISFAKIMQKGKPMTRREALQFVFHGDTSKLTCLVDQYDLATEKLVGTIKSENLPIKCIKIEMKKYLMIAYSFQVCQSKEPEIVYVVLSIYNKAYQLMDRLVVYREKYDFPEIIGVVNSKNGNIVLTGYLKTELVNPSDPKTEAYATFFSVDLTSLKFKSIREANIDGDFTNVMKSIKNLGWETFFFE